MRKCDRWISFIDTLARGKKNDDVSCNAFVDHIIDWHHQQPNFNFNSIDKHIIHSDNCGNQFKCRQNFVQLSIKANKYLATFAHKFTQKYGFKGPCDGNSKLIRGTISQLELKLTRIANAFDSYTQLSKELTQDKTDYFTQLKEQRSEKILKKLTFTT